MNQELSSLMDGELDEQEAGRAIKSCCGSLEMTQAWATYHVIGEVLRGEVVVQRASTMRLMAALEKEPTVLAPQRQRGMGEGAMRVAFAVAASVATVSVVAWIGLTGRPDATPAVVASTPATALRSTGVPMAVNEYLTVHRQVPSPDAYMTVSEQQRAGPKR